MSTEQRVSEWVRAHLSKRLGVAPESIDFEKGLGTYGLDSVDGVLMAGELEEAFGVEIDPARFLQCESFEQTVAMLVADIDGPKKQPASG
ncbi:MAG: acyl carrier protein [Bryobacteraceae bacterium]